MDHLLGTISFTIYYHARKSWHFQESTKLRCEHVSTLLLPLSRLGLFILLLSVAGFTASKARAVCISMILMPTNCAIVRALCPSVICGSAALTYPRESAKDPRMKT